MRDSTEGLHDGRDVYSLIERDKYDIVTEVIERNTEETAVDFAIRVAEAVYSKVSAVPVPNRDNPSQVIIVYLKPKESNVPKGWSPSQATINAIQGRL